MAGPAPPRAPKPKVPRPALREPALAFVAVVALASGLYWTGRAVPLVRANLHALIAVSFFYAPVAAEALGGRRFDFRDAGLRLDPLRLNLAVLLAAAAIVLPLFVLGFFLFYDLACARGTSGAGAGAGAWAASALARLCPSPTWRGFGGGHLRLPSNLAMLAATQVLVIALPEEVFFRGYLLGRLEERWPSKRRLAGAPVGPALVTSALLFGLGHVLVDFNPQRLSVFFPALVFGWMRARTGSLAAGAAFHALCNLLADVLHTSTF